MPVSLATRLRALRAFSFPVSVLPVAVATAIVRSPSEWDWPILIASMLGVMLLHGAGNLFNDYFDFKSGVDRKLDDDESRPGRFLVRGELLPKDIFIQALVCLLLALPVGIFLIFRCGPSLLYFAGAAGVGLYCYTGPPLNLKYRALGEPLIFAVFGPCLMLGAAYAQTGLLHLQVLLLSIPVGLATTAIVTSNNIRDHEEDSIAGVRTLARVIGPRALRWFYILQVFGCVLSLVGLAIAGVGPILLVFAPVLLILILKPLICVWQSKRLADIDARTARFESVLLVFMLLSLLLQDLPS